VSGLPGQLVDRPGGLLITGAAEPSAPFPPSSAHHGSPPSTRAPRAGGLPNLVTRSAEPRSPTPLPASSHSDHLPSSAVRVHRRRDGPCTRWGQARDGPGARRASTHACGRDCPAASHAHGVPCRLQPGPGSYAHFATPPPVRNRSIKRANLAMCHLLPFQVDFGSNDCGVIRQRRHKPVGCHHGPRLLWRGRYKATAGKPVMTSNSGRTGCPEDCSSARTRTSQRGASHRVKRAYAYRV
jgi:hypothetical protein